MFYIGILFFLFLHKEKKFWYQTSETASFLRTRMEKTQIAQIASQMSSREDFLTLVNLIWQDEMGNMGFDADMFHPFTMKHILYYCNPNNVFHRYRQFKIKKKKKGEFREITAPRNRSFMILLQTVNEVLKAMYSPSNYAMGFTEGRSVVDNANVHKGQNYIFNIDLKDFFPSIVQPRVWKRLQLKPFNFPVEIANLIAGLCSMRKACKDTEGKVVFTYILPQGAPTSPIITNMICDTLDRRLAGLAKRFGLHYTRYADDITFSSMHHVYSEKGEFRKELVRIITEQGFIINTDKTRLQKRGSRQEVTGIIVSNKLNVTKKYVRDIRNILYIWDRYGYTAAMAKFLPKYKAEKGHVKKGNPDLRNVIDGKLMYLKMVKGENDSVYQRLYAKFKSLIEKEQSNENTNSLGISYIETTPIPLFEKANVTTLTMVHTEENKRYAVFTLGGSKQYATFNKSVRTEDEHVKEILAISNCRDSKGEQFWLIHYADKVTIPKPPSVDIDELNEDLDILLNIENG